MRRSSILVAPAVTLVTAASVAAASEPVPASTPPERPADRPLVMFSTDCGLG